MRSLPDRKFLAFFLLFFFAPVTSPEAQMISTPRASDDSSIRPDGAGRVVMLTPDVEIRADEHGAYTRLFRPNPGAWAAMDVQLPESQQRFGTDAEPAAHGWKSLALYGGSLTCAAVSPVDRNLVLIGMEDGPVSGSLFQSLDGGVSWSRIELPSSAPSYVYKGWIYDVEFAPNGAAYVATSTGLLRRLAGEGAFSLFTNFPYYEYFTEISVNPVNPDEIWLGGYYALGSASPRMYRSRDAGASWDNVTPPVGPMTCTGIAFKSSDPGIVVASYGFNTGEIWRSGDGGTTWAKRASLSNSVYTDVVYDGSRFWASAERYTQAGVFVSADDGVTWRRANTGQWPSNQVYDLAVDPAQPGTVLAATASGLTRLKDGVWSFRLGGTEKKETAACLFPADPNRIIVGQNSEGVLRSNDGGQTFAVSSTGVLALDVRSVACNPADPMEMAAGYEAFNSGGIFISKDGGETWKGAPGIVNASSGLEYAPDGTLYAAVDVPVQTMTPGVYRCSPNGTWKALGPFVSQSYIEVKTIRVDRLHPEIVVIGGIDYNDYTLAIWRSTDRGDHWTRVYDATANSSGGLSFVVEVQFINDGTGQHLLAAAQQGGVLHSEDGGVTWSPVAGVPASASGNRLRGTPADPNTFYISGSILYRTRDAGKTWAPCQISDTFSAFDVDRAHPDILYGADNNPRRVVRVERGGTTLDDFNEGCPLTYGYDFAWREGACPTLFFATTAGVFAREIDSTPPSVSLVLEPDVLWPPDHKMKTIRAHVIATDACDSHPTFALKSIAVEDEAGAPQDVEANIGEGTTTFQLRAERPGKGERRYIVTYTATDEAGNVTEASGVVHVPHDQSGATLSDQAAPRAARMNTELVSIEPNPFNPSTAVMITLAQTEPMSLDVYDVRGARVRNLASGAWSAGSHRIAWDGRDDGGHPAASGVYFFRFVAEGRAQTMKALLLK